MLDLELKTEVNPLTLTELSKYHDFAAKSQDGKSTKGVACWYLKTAEAARFLFGFLPFSW